MTNPWLSIPADDYVGHMFVNPDDLASMARAAGLTLDLRRTVPLAGGKSFELVRLVRP